MDVAFAKARETASKTGTAPVPFHIRNAPTQLMKDLGYGADYRFPHDDPEGWVPEVYLPRGLVGSVFYEPTARGWEGKWRPFLDERRERVRKAVRDRFSED